VYLLVIGPRRIAGARQSFLRGGVALGYLPVICRAICQSRPGERSPGLASGVVTTLASSCAAAC